jgi:hypothetical protein
MDDGSGKPLPAFGFLTVLESAEHGLFGGYLVLSALGRPLEFRCSTPIAPSRAQQILYGPTLRPYLLAEVIGQALVSGSELPVRVILTDQRDMLPLGMLRSEIVIYVEPAPTTGEVSAEKSFDLAGCRVSAAELSALSHGELQAMLAPLAAHVNLCEPFGRILAALLEAQMASPDAGSGVSDDSAAAA